MIDWREPLYLDEKMKDGSKVASVQALAEKGKSTLFPVYGVFLAQNPDNLLEIISLNELLQPGYGSRVFHCVGLAGNREGAEHLVQIIVEETLRNTGGVRVQEFLYPDGRNSKGD